MDKINKMRILECVLLSFDISNIELNKLFTLEEIEKAKDILNILNKNER